jgi:hypothetical protein
MRPSARSRQHPRTDRRRSLSATLGLLVGLAVTGPVMADPADGEAAQRLSAAFQVAAQLQPPPTELTDVTPLTDNEGLLGLPEQYTSKAIFLEGSVEVFRTPADRNNRRAGLDPYAEFSFIADFNGGSVLLRLNRQTVSEAQATRMARSLSLAAVVLQ